MIELGRVIAFCITKDFSPGENGPISISSALKPGNQRKSFMSPEGKKSMTIKKMDRKDFYCKRICVDPDFSIDEWNEASRQCDELGIEGIERDKILHPELFPCDKQCESCINTVLDTRIKNSNLSKV